jgi:hypothetical protein
MFLAAPQGIAGLSVDAAQFPRFEQDKFVEVRSEN